MQFPDRFSALPDYAFPRLRALLSDVDPARTVLRMSIGEPKHAFPHFAAEIITQNAARFGNYPNNNGIPELLEAANGWLSRRFGITGLGDDNIIALNGTREGLFAATLALCPEKKNGEAPVVIVPNPFYQAYMMGARMLNAELYYANTTEASNFLPDLDAIDEATWKKTAAFYICSPSNPQGKIADIQYQKRLIALAEAHDFYIFADECYAEIYSDAAPQSFLKTAQDMNADEGRVICFHSLSKRSNMPGLRSGFAVGGKAQIAMMRKLRAYAGAPLPEPIQMASAALWNNDTHVTENRNLYLEKFELVRTILGSEYVPEGGFFLWLPVESGEQAAKDVYQNEGLEALPGEYLAATVNGFNPATNRLRVALVAPKDDIERGLYALKTYIKKN